MVKGRGQTAELNFDLSNIQIPQKYILPIPLSPEKHADLQKLVSEWVPPVIKRNYWDKILSGQNETTAQNEVQNDNNYIDDNNNLIDNIDHDDDDIDDLCNDPEPVDPLLATNFFDYD